MTYVNKNLNKGSNQMTSLQKKDFLTNQSYVIYDSDTMPFKNQTISHFALSDSLTTFIGKRQHKAAIHFWSTNQLVIIGMMDTKLPHLSDGLAVLTANQQAYIVRNSGGLAVASDPGILNFSLIFSEELTNRITIDEGYDFMFRLVSETFKEYSKPIEAYEISDSYCPGDFDLSINGKKIAGIAQRRIKNGVAIMIYLSVTGDQNKRAQLLQDFYTAGLQDEQVKWHFPKINPAVMGTLEELLGVKLTVQNVKEKIIQTLQERHCTFEIGEYTPEILSLYEESKQKMIDRNLQMLKESVQKELLI